MHSGFNLSILLLVLLSLGVWLRSWNYAAWTLMVILAASLLQDFSTGFLTNSYLWVRIVCIFIGALLAISAAWFILPIQSTGVVRKRIGEILEKASAYMADPTDENKINLDVALKKLDDIVDPWRLWHIASRHKQDYHQPWVWINLTHEVIKKITMQKQFSKEVRILLGEARKSLLTPEKIEGSLLHLKNKLE